MSESNSPDFMELSTDVAKRFLHTVVFVDDRAIFKEIHLPTALTPPKRMAKKEKDIKEQFHRSAHTLNVKKVTDEFASKGMICSVLRPNEGDNTIEYVKQSAKRADVFILDWDINNDSGETAREIINMLISLDDSEYSRLRLIIIYTGEPDIYSISNSIKEKITEEFDTDFNSDDNDFAFQKGHFRIAIFAKEETIVNPGCEERVLSITDLPERLSIEFAKITSGLVSNVAIESLSVLRDNTHLFLSNLGSEIDPSYLAHRALLPVPDDAKNLAVDIVASEFHSLLENFEVGDVANINAIYAWLRMKKSDDSYSLNGSWGGLELTREDICECQRIGIEKSDWESRLANKKRNNFKNNVHSTLTQTFCDEGENFQELDYKFAILTSIKNRYGGDLSPILTLGTILKKKSDNPVESEKYFICLQPRCDCVRIEDNKNFSFLPLVKEDRENFKSDIVIKIDDINYEILKVNQKIYDLIQFNFSSNCADDQIVRAEREESDYIFKTTDEKSRFKWISELKNQHAQRIANDFAASISRVGLDESEWLRRT